MVKILHISDCHFGLKYNKFAADLKEKLILEREVALKRAVQMANQENCDFFVIAGDLFENLKISKKIQLDVVRWLDDFEGEAVIILPGNHDYADKNFWQDFAVNSDKIIILSECKTYKNLSEKPVTFYACPCSDKHSEHNALDWIDIDGIEQDQINIGIAHGAVEGWSLDADNKYYFMTEKDLLKYPMDIWLIGHAHVPIPKMAFDETQIGAKLYSAGTHQQTDIANRTEGSVFIIEISDDKTVKATRKRTGGIRFIEEKITVSHADSLESKLKEQLNIANPENTLLRLNIAGIAPAADFDAKYDIFEAATESFLYVFEPNFAGLKKEITSIIIDAETLAGTIENAWLHSLKNDANLLNVAFDLVKECKEGNS